MIQVNLRGMLEFTACCGFLFAVGPSRDLILYGIAGAVVAIWSLRVSHWTIRWLLFNWTVAFSSIFLGLACLEHALLGRESGDAFTQYWLLCGCAMIVWTPLAAVNGCLFFVAWLNRDPPIRTRTRFRRNEAT